MSDALSGAKIPSPRSEPLRESAPGGETPLFRQLAAAETGLDFVYRWTTDPRYEKLLNSSLVGGGVAAGDYDGDGLPDLCLTRPAGGCRLYRNLGGFRFRDVTGPAGIGDDGAWTTGAAFADVNNDGLLDLYVCCYASPNRLYVNRGDGTFVESAKSYGLDFVGASVMMAFGDYDRDGRLDGYLLTAGMLPTAAQRFRVKFVDGRPVVPEELREYWQIFYLPGERAAMAEAGQLDRLFHNQGDGTFKEVSPTAGIAGCDFGNAAVWWDYDGDGWPDLYVANDYFGPDHLYRNNRDGSFKDVAREVLPHTPWTSMGADIADFNRDGRLDLIASDMSGTTHFKRQIDSGDMEKNGWFLDYPEPRQYMRNALFINSGAGPFLEAASLAGLANTDWTWSIVTGDLDNDGWEDVFVPNGMTRDWMDNDLAMQAQKLPPAEFAKFWRAQPIRADRNLAFQNHGDLRFTQAAAMWGLDHAGPSFGAVLTDLDGDGRLDLVVNDFEAPVRVYRHAADSRHRVQVRLRGTVSNRFGFGATVRIETRDGQQTRHLTSAHGFMSAPDPTLHFGLGPAAEIDRLRVEWPSGRVQSFKRLAADRLYTIEEPAAASIPSSPPAPPAMFAVSARVSPTPPEPVAAEESSFQPLLPYRFSQLGSGLAVADVDGDGREDLYLCATTRRPGQLLRQDARGEFHVDAGSGFPVKAPEMAALFFDANRDGAPDLCVVEGGEPTPANPVRFQNCLYLNDGRGHFQPAPEGSLPDQPDSGGAVVATDFDRDGDLDLFLAGRWVPGRYPLAPSSRLLRNEGGRFTDVTDEVAPALRRAGLVTGALWSDADQDGWPELLLSCEWGPIRLFRNERGRLVERTTEAGLASLLGGWNGIAAADLDGDGDVDYVVTNLGRNTRYAASPAEPSRIYYGDFGSPAGPQVVEAFVEAGTTWPVRGRNALEKTMPWLRDRYPTHHDFARADLATLFGTNALATAVRLEINTLDSGVLLNDGTGRFRFRPLPRLAQIAPAFGVAVADADGDGIPDVYLAQNFFGVQRETGRMNGGLSLLLLGKGDGSFEPVPPDRSGLVVPEDGKSLVTLDLNGDRRPDFVVGLGQGGYRAFENRSSPASRAVSLRLVGRPGNPSAVGARVRLGLRGGGKRVAEVYAGGGYLSQSSSDLLFALPPAEELERVEVRWPDGKVTTHTSGLAEPNVVLRQD